MFYCQNEKYFYYYHYFDGINFICPQCRGKAKIYCKYCHRLHGGGEQPCFFVIAMHIYRLINDNYTYYSFGSIILFIPVINYAIFGLQICDSYNYQLHISGERINKKLNLCTDYYYIASSIIGFFIGIPFDFLYEIFCNYLCYYSKNIPIR